MTRCTLDVSPTEAVAIAMALYGLAGTPLHADAASALRKLVLVMPDADLVTARELADLASRGSTPTVPRVVADALHDRTVLRIEYADRHGVPTTRSIEPLGYVSSGLWWSVREPAGPPPEHDHWFLVAWCRMRQAVRAFRTDRIESLIATGEPALPRRLAAADLIEAGRPLTSGGACPS
jgi:predicted DNA-binding transcriptional regulator YafY